jgi:hypothetical protein
MGLIFQATANALGIWIKPPLTWPNASAHMAVAPVGLLRKGNVILYSPWSQHYATKGYFR